MKSTAAQGCLCFEVVGESQNHGRGAKTLDILNPDPVLRASLSRDTVYQGAPDFACRARDERDIVEALATCHRSRIPLTVCGSQTSITGASAADSGLVLSLTRLNRILEISPDPATGGGWAVVEPGVLIADLKDAARAAGLFYPPDPTSFREATIGASVATNATGEDTFKYGSTRSYVNEIALQTIDGRALTLARSVPAPTRPAKNTAGYFLDGEEIDAFIGAEGTLGIITSLRLRLLPGRDRGFILFVLPFKDFAACLQAVVHLQKTKAPARAIELVGPGAAEYFTACPDCPLELRGRSCFLYLKGEFTDAGGPETILEDWTARLEGVYHAAGNPAGFQDVITALTTAQQEAIRRSRHFIPLKVNEAYFPFVAQGGGKIGTDWWVPLHHLEEMMLPVYDEARGLGIPFLVFAHIGNGHPHWNFLTRTAAEKQRALEFVNRQCWQAALFGGGVAGEHGLGKIRRDLLTVQHSPKVVRKMIDLKRRWDPEWLLGRGNILKPC